MCDVTPFFPSISYNYYFVSYYSFSNIVEFFLKEEVATIVGQIIGVTTTETLTAELSADSDLVLAGQFFFRIIGDISPFYLHFDIGNIS